MKINKDETKYALAFGQNTKIGAVSFKMLADTKIPFSKLYQYKLGDLNNLRLPRTLVGEMAECQKNIDPDKIIARYQKEGISFIFLSDKDYPYLLSQIYDPPAILYYRGSLYPDETIFGIVGSRKPTDYGKAVTKEMSFSLAQSGLTIASGLAFGIDSIAHTSALEAHARTIAVLGCGLDRIYPSEHSFLADKISAAGAIMSEYPLGMPPLRHNFPARNRIISGLSVGLLITEAAAGSGSLITARNALEQNRQVFAVPGPIYNKNSYGPNQLIKLGAKPVTEAGDILEELGIKAMIENKAVGKPKSEGERLVFTILDHGPAHIDEVIRKSKKTHAEISSLLTLMEISGKIKHLGGMVYRLNK